MFNSKNGRESMINSFIEHKKKIIEKEHKMLNKIGGKSKKFSKLGMVGDL